MKFTILHLSDAHLGNPRHIPDAHSVMRPLFKDLRLQTEKNKPDLIIFNGDMVYGTLTNCHISQQIESAKAWLKELYNSIGLPYLQVPIFMVPGNHDLDRTLIQPDQKAWVRSLSESSPIDDAMRDNGTFWKRLTERQCAWFDFLRSLNQNWTIEANSTLIHGQISWCGKTIAVIGANSAWASQDENDDGKLWLGQYQLQRAVEIADKHDIRLFVVHHPTSWLHNSERNGVTQRIATNFHFSFNGHDHENWYEELTGHIRISAGACYAGSSRENAYGILQFDSNMEDVTLTLRVYNNKGATGWTPLELPGKNGTAGVYRLRAPWAEVTSCPIAPPTITQAPAQISVASPSMSADTTSALIAAYERLFSFRWERENVDLAAHKTAVYWPVKLRDPSAIHAMQCFAAAGLLKNDADVYLCFDDWGNTEGVTIGVFMASISRWLARVGQSANALKVVSLKECSGQPDMLTRWTLASYWLGASDTLNEVLRVVKLPPITESAHESAMPTHRPKKPARLLGPPIVWSYLQKLRTDLTAHSLITLGGHDEQVFWDAWRRRISSQATGHEVAHLYIPELKMASPGQVAANVHMATTPLAWHSRDDVERDIRNDVTASLSDQSWAKDDRLCWWTLMGCYALPSWLSGKPIEITLMGHLVSSPADLLKLDSGKIPEAIADLLTPMLL